MVRFFATRILNPYSETAFRNGPAAQASAEYTNSLTENLKILNARKPVSTKVGAPRKDFYDCNKVAAAPKLAPQAPPNPTL